MDDTKYATFGGQRYLFLTNTTTPTSCEFRVGEKRRIERPVATKAHTAEELEAMGFKSVWVLDPKPTK